MTDRKEIERLFKEHYLRLWRLAVAMLHDPEAARDVVHDLFAAVLDGRGAVALSEAYLQQNPGRVKIRENAATGRRSFAISTVPTVSAAAALLASVRALPAS